MQKKEKTPLKDPAKPEILQKGLLKILKERTGPQYF